MHTKLYLYSFQKGKWPLVVNIYSLPGKRRSGWCDMERLHTVHAVMSVWPLFSALYTHTRAFKQPCKAKRQPYAPHYETGAHIAQ
jgi:hypothetical protein